MNKLTSIKIKYNNGTYSDEIPIGVLADNVDWDSTHSLTDIIGNTSTLASLSTAGTIMGALNEMNAVDSAMSSTSTNPVQNKVINTALGNKVDKVTGKGLSTNDYTTDEKTKLAGIAAEANKTTVDSAMSSTSTNPVQNKVINTALSGKLATTGDSKDLTTTFTSSDVADGSASSWTSVGALANTEKHSSIFAKVSQMFKNIRWLYKILGTTDISSLSDAHTVTGALAKLNTDSIKPTVAGSTLLPSGADLNNYRVPGLYHTNSQSLTATILNCPISSVAFRLIVQDTGYGYSTPSEANFCNQIIYASGGIYTRRYGNASGSWTDWKVISDSTLPDVAQLNTDLITASSATRGTATAPGGSVTGTVGYHTKGFYTTISSSNVSIPAVSSSGWVLVATLPEGSRPYVVTNSIGIKNNASGASDMPIQVRINTNGKIQAYMTAARGQVDLYFSIVFLSLY